METAVGEEPQQERNDGDNDGSDGGDNDGLRSRIEELKERIVSLNDQAKGFIKEHPVACLAGALGLGYIFARIARRRS
jgi:hypothetical protein